MFDRYFIFGFRKLDKVIGKREEGNEPSTKEILEDMYKAVSSKFIKFLFNYNEILKGFIKVK